MRTDSLAHQVVKETLSRLPAKLQAAAKQLPVCFEERPARSLLDDGLPPDVLGLFVGAPRHEHDSQPGPPPQIILYLENIREESTAEGTGFTEEIARTYLHELGHYLGLDEEALAERDLD